MVQVQIHGAGSSFVMQTIAVGAFKGCIRFYVCREKEKEEFFERERIGE